jgi:hypothetical protein
MPRKERSFSGKPILHFCLSPAGVRYSQKEASATIRPIKDTPRRLFGKAGNDRLVKKREFVELVVRQFE